MNPYEVLGVSENASDDEIKKAYRELVKQYHPDRYRDNPLSSLAEEKIKQINEAYDSITKQRENKGYSQNRYSGYRQENSYSSSSKDIFSKVIELIEKGDFASAESILSGISPKNARWYYVYGLLYRKKGWYNEAAQCFAQAFRMDPYNSEYQAAYNEMQHSADYYDIRSRNARGNYSNSACDILQALCCADCCCECLGGDLIRCC